MPRARTGTPAVAAVPGSLWWVRSVHASAAGPQGRAPVVLHGVATAARPDGTVVDVGGVPAAAALAGRVARVSVCPDTLRLLRVELLGEHAPSAPRLVLAERLRPDAPGQEARRGGAELAAFDHRDVAARAAPLGAHVAPGAVLTEVDAARLGLRPADAVGVATWSPSTGEPLAVHGVPARAAVTTFLVLAAEGACAARGWPLPRGTDARAPGAEGWRRRLRGGVRPGPRPTPVPPLAAPRSARPTGAPRPRGPVD